MNWFQRLFTSIVPKAWAEDMQAESMRWTIRCIHCKHERSIWEMGGIRWKAVGNSRHLMKCPQCGRRSWHESYLKPAE